MSLELYASSFLEKLSDQLLADLDHPGNGVFDPRWIITQTDGIDGWLRERMACHRGISLNDRFIRTNDVLVQLYRLLCPTAPRALERDTLVWIVYSALLEDEFVAKHPGIGAYYRHNETRRMSLALEMSDQFDQYQIYRHDTVQKWNRGESLDNWQADLWACVHARLGKAYSDRTQMAQAVLSALQSDTNREWVRKKFPAMHFFGLAIVTPFYLELFYQLSTLIPVRFYLLNPAPDAYWMDRPVNQKLARLTGVAYGMGTGEEGSGNALLQRWGRILRESFELLMERDEYVNRYQSLDPEPGTGQPIGRETLLQRIQEEIRSNTPESERAELNGQTDHSLQFTGCYTPAREVEVLYNRLIEAFAADKSLGARDVVVLTPDINVYAPFIRAVFSNGHQPIPFSIADESIDRGNTLFSDLKKILSIDSDTCKAEEVLSLLESPRVRARFGIQDLRAVRRAVREAAIYFGTEGVATEGAEPEGVDNECWMVGWTYGLQKMIYGLCMSRETVFEMDGRQILTLDTAEGAEMADRIRLAHFVRSLLHVLHGRNQRKKLEEWSEYLNYCLRELVLAEAEEDDDYRRFLKLRDKLLGLDEWASGESIGFTTFRQVFLVKLSQEQRSSQFAGRGVCFCSMVPMRSVPFRFVALLGMDFEQFPRQTNTVSFSLLGGSRHRAGDRNLRENDKHLFLETLMAARDTLYISYLARDAHRGSELPPSTLVDELISYISTKCPDPAAFRRHAVCIHPLHGFSRRYHQTESGLPPNYLTRMWLQSKVGGYSHSGIMEPVNIPLTIELDRFCRFFINPVKDYFNRQLAIYFREDEEGIREHELFEFDHLQKYVMNDQFLGSDKTVEEFLTDFVERGKRTGQLPLSRVGPVLTRQILEEIMPLIEARVRILGDVAPRNLDVHCVSDAEYEIMGPVSLYGSCLVYIVPSEKILKRAMSEWVRFLLVMASSGAELFDLLLIYKGDKREAVKVVRIVGNQELKTFARQHLRELLRWFLKGHQEPVPFSLPLAQYAKEKSDLFTPDGLNKAYLHSSDDFYSDFPWVNDSYWQAIIEQPDGSPALFTDEGVQKMKEVMDALSNEFFKQWEIAVPKKEKKPKK